MTNPATIVELVFVLLALLVVAVCVVANFVSSYREGRKTANLPPREFQVSIIEHSLRGKKSIFEHHDLGPNGGSVVYDLNDGREIHVYAGRSS